MAVPGVRKRIRAAERDREGAEADKGTSRDRERQSGRGGGGEERGEVETERQRAGPRLSSCFNPQAYHVAGLELSRPPSKSLTVDSYTTAQLAADGQSDPACLNHSSYRTVQTYIRKGNEYGTPYVKFIAFDIGRGLPSDPPFHRSVPFM